MMNVDENGSQQLFGFMSVKQLCMTLTLKKTFLPQP